MIVSQRHDRRARHPAQPLDEATRTRLADHLRRVGAEAAAHDLGVSRESLLRAACGLEVRQGTAWQVTVALATILDGEGGARGSPPAEIPTSSAAAVMPGPTETR